MSRSGIKLHGKGRTNTGRDAKVEGNVFTYNGVGRSTGLVKILEPLSPLLNYFELEILERGDESAIGIGVGHMGYSQRAMPGWERNSIGYHADDGKLYHERGFGKQFGPLCTKGDRMGCGIDFTSDETKVFFTKNGRQVGDMQTMRRPLGGLYPLIGLHSVGEKIRYLGHWRKLSKTLSEPMELEASPSEYWLRSNGIKFCENLLTLEYAGNQNAGQDVAIAQANFPISYRNHYFELEILDKGVDGAIAIGLGKATYPLHRHPGWNNGGVGYHADDGKLFTGHGLGQEFGPNCTTGDRMGCGVKFASDDDWEIKSNNSGSDISEEENFNLDDNDDDDEENSDDSSIDSFYRYLKLAKDRSHQKNVGIPRENSRDQQWTVYFTKNGDVIGETECPVPSGGFYPVVAMLSRGEKIKIDFEPLSG